MKLLAAPINQGPQQPEQQEEPEQGPSSLKRKHDEAPSSSKRNTFKYDVWHSPLEFLDKALQAKHPVDADSFLHEATKAAIEKVLVTDPVTLAKQRLAVVFNLRKLQSEMSSKELESRRGMHQDVDKCTKSKPIALFAHVLKQVEYWDLGVVDLLREGIPLVGLQESPKGYVKNLVPASITEDELMASAFWRRRTMMCDHRDWTSEEQKALLETTAEEVKMGFLEGPYNEEEISVLLETDQWSLNPRFVLFQGSSRKVRIIDDAKKSCVNEAFSSTVKLQLQDVDYVASMITFVAKEAASRGISLDLKGKTFDLSKAYKQLAVRPDHHKHAIVGFPIDGDWKFYRSISLPFGCTGSVYGFVRISQALWYVITRLLHCVCSHYFDDYPVVETAAGCKVLSSAISAVFDILGWTYAKEGDKAFPFAVELMFWVSLLTSAGYPVAPSSYRTNTVALRNF